MFYNYDFLSQTMISTGNHPTHETFSFANGTVNANLNKKTGEITVSISYLLHDSTASQIKNDVVNLLKQRTNRMAQHIFTNANPQIYNNQHKFSKIRSYFTKELMQIRKHVNKHQREALSAMLLTATKQSKLPLWKAFKYDVKQNTYPERRQLWNERKSSIILANLLPILRNQVAHSQNNFVKNTNKDTVELELCKHLNKLNLYL